MVVPFDYAFCKLQAQMLSPDLVRREIADSRVFAELSDPFMRAFLQLLSIDVWGSITTLMRSNVSPAITYHVAFVALLAEHQPQGHRDVTADVKPNWRHGTAFRHEEDFAAFTSAFVSILPPHQTTLALNYLSVACIEPHGSFEQLWVHVDRFICNIDLADERTRVTLQYVSRPLRQWLRERVEAGSCGSPKQALVALRICAMVAEGADQEDWLASPPVVAILHNARSFAVLEPRDFIDAMTVAIDIIRRIESRRVHNPEMENTLCGFRGVLATVIWEFDASTCDERDRREMHRLASELRLPNEHLVAFGVRLGLAR